MKTVTLGRTNITVNRDALGALPLQRCNTAEAVTLIHACLDAGINFIDTARAYSDSEEKLGIALSGRRDKVTISTKSFATDAKGLFEQLETSLRNLKTDFIDIYQLHNPSFVPVPGGEDGLYDACLEARRQGKIRYIGITNHKITLAREALNTGLYDTIQFPFSYLASEADVALAEECKERNVGFIAMKALSGGLITDIGAARAFMSQYGNVLPIWGIQRLSEVDALVKARESGDDMTPERKARIEKDRAELVGEFCRGCGYCMPCPAGIQLNNCTRMPQFIRRAPFSAWKGFKAEMEKTRECIHCGQCAKKCPYGLNPAELLPRNLADYLDVYEKTTASSQGNQ